MKLFKRPEFCSCGSGLYRYELVDARGIFCSYVCESCEQSKKQKYQPEIFDDSDYECDEDIDED